MLVKLDWAHDVLLIAYISTFLFERVDNRTEASFHARTIFSPWQSAISPGHCSVHHFEEALGNIDGACSGRDDKSSARSGSTSTGRS